VPAKKKVFAIHPGEILREEFMKPMGLISYQLAKELYISIPRVNDIVRERRAVTADTALRLARYFGGDARTWMNLQIEYDLRIAESKADLRSVRPRKTTAG
jgi:addiction module HigA family antidote